MHRAAVWNDLLLVHGGVFQVVLGDTWGMNMSIARLQDADSTMFDGAGSLSGATQFLFIMVIIMILFFIVFVTLMYRRFHREQRLQPSDLEEELEDQPRGLPENVLKKFPLVKYKKKKVVDGEDPSEEDLCPICLVSMDEQEASQDLM